MALHGVFWEIFKISDTDQIPGFVAYFTFKLEVCKYQFYQFICDGN